MEKEIKKIWVVTSGDYSDYSISCVFSTKKLAKLFIKEKDNDRYRLEEYTLNFPNVVLDKLRNGYKRYETSMAKDGFVNECKITTEIDDRDYFMGNNNLLYNFTWSKSTKHAIKITNEVRVQLIANKVIN